MPVSVATFKAKHREFDAVDDADVSTALDDALSEMNVDAWGDHAERGQRLLAAHILAMTPFGQNAGLRAGGGANQTSIYWSQYDDLRKRVGGSRALVLE